MSATAGYEPLDLDPFRNAGLEWAKRQELAQKRSQALLGLPFLLGTDEARCFVGFGEGAHTSPLTIRIGRRARTVIFAHSLAGPVPGPASPIADGVPVAIYRFVRAEGDPDSVTIRSRFEIGPPVYMFGPDMFGPAFAAHPERYWGVGDRFTTPVGGSGQRQTEVSLGAAVGDYLIWVWRNPRPEVPLESLTIEPGAFRFLIGGITFGDLDEHPVVRRPSQPVRVSVAGDPAAAELDISVDRGMAGYSFRLPAESAEEFLGDPLAGWGQPDNPRPVPAVVEVAGTPSATVTVLQAGSVLGSVAWGEVLSTGSAADGPVRIEALESGRNWVRTVVVDDSTGEPLACRIHFRSDAGVPYQPHGHHNRINSDLGSWHVDVGGDLRLEQATYAYIDGTCQGWLPRGEVLVDVARGFEYEPLRTRVTIAPGQRELTLRLKRWTDMNRLGWFSGDTHVHFLSTQGAQREAMGEDLNVVNLLQSQWGHLFTNTEEFIGEPAVSRDGRTIVYTSQENRQHLLGHLTLLGLKRPVMPWCSDGPAEAELAGPLETTLSHWADECHGQGGFVVIPHFPVPNGEPAALVATGRADAVEMLIQEQRLHDEYYGYLNCGYRLPLVGGTDKMTSDVPVGLYRTYVRIPPDEPFDYYSWCRNMAKGRTFLSGGPMLSFSVDGGEIGDTVSVRRGGHVEITATADSIFPLHTLEIVQHGRVIASATDAAGARHLELHDRFRVDGDTWLAARASGPGYFSSTPHRDGWGRGIFAHTSPIYLTTGSEYQVFDRAVAEYMLTMVEGSMRYITEVSAQHAPGTVTHHHAESDHGEYLLRPFRQAEDAIRARLGLSES